MGGREEGERRGEGGSSQLGRPSCIVNETSGERASERYHSLVGFCLLNTASPDTSRKVSHLQPARGARDSAFAVQPENRVLVKPSNRMAKLARRTSQIMPYTWTWGKLFLSG